jgi:hypothetical protein
MEHQTQLQEQIQHLLAVEVVVQNQHQDHQELVEMVVVEQEEMLLMVQRELQTLEEVVELVLEEQVVAEHSLQVMVVQVSWLQDLVILM